jgi:cytidylate kinase
MNKPLTIAIDGPSAAGKTTLAKRLAKDLSYLYFDTGVMYRAVTLAALESGIDLDNERAVVRTAESICIDVLPPTVQDGRAATVLLDHEDVTWALRESRIDQKVSIPSAYPGVRNAVNQQLRRIAEQGPVVMVGRDIGTVVLPDADLKLYLDASAEARARRRWQENRANHQEVEYEAILRDMRHRDKLDAQRDVAPMRPADDAVILDTTEVNAEEVLAFVLDLIHRWDEK